MKYFNVCSLRVIRMKLTIDMTSNPMITKEVPNIPLMQFLMMSRNTYLIFGMLFEMEICLKFLRSMLSKSSFDVSYIAECRGLLVSREGKRNIFMQQISCCVFIELNKKVLLNFYIQSESTKIQKLKKHACISFSHV